MSAIDSGALVEGLRHAGLRVTRPRRLICEVLAAVHDDHPTAADLHRLVEARAEVRVDLSTVYRTIEALERVEAIHHVHLGHGPAVIHLSDHADHHHLVCDVCGRTEDIPVEELDELTKRLEEKYSFTAAGFHFAMIGRCTVHEKPNQS